MPQITNQIVYEMIVDHGDYADIVRALKEREIDVEKEVNKSTVKFADLDGFSGFYRWLGWLRGEPEATAIPCRDVDDEADLVGNLLVMGEGINPEAQSALRSYRELIRKNIARSGMVREITDEVRDAIFAHADSWCRIRSRVSRS